AELRGMGAVDSHLVLDPGDCPSWSIGLHGKRADSMMALVGLRHRKHDRDLRLRRIGDEVLRAVDNVRVAGEYRSRLLPRSIRTSLRLGQREASEPFAGRHIWKKVVLLLLASQAEDRPRCQRAVG